MTKIHSQITEEDEIHYPRGFVQTPTDTQRVPVKNTNGTYVWTPTDQIAGTEGPPGPPLPTINVVNISDPTELNTLDDSVSSQYIVTQKGTDPTEKDRSSYYIYESGATMTEYPALVVDGLNGKWIMMTGDSLLISTTKTASTNCLIGGTVTVNAGDASTIDVSATTVAIIDNYTDLINPKTTIVSVPETLAIPVDNIAAFETSYVYIDVNGIQQTSTIGTADFFREKVLLATLYHNDNATVGLIGNTPFFSLGVGLAGYDLNLALGPINLTGNVFGSTPDNDLEITKTAGQTFLASVNSLNDLKNPNFSQDVALTGGETNIKSYQDGSGGFTFLDSNSIDPTVWDDGSGVLATIPATEWSNKRLYWSPAIQEFASVIGQAKYATKDEALDAVSTADWNLPEQLNYWSHRATLTCIQSATDLSDSAQAVFTTHGKFGGGSVSAGSPAVVTLKEAYDNSNGQPITTTLAGNPFTVTRGSGASTTIFDLHNSSDVSVFDVNDTGAITGTNATQTIQGLMSATDKTKLDGIPQGWMQYSNGNIVSSASAAPVPITLDVDEASFANSLFTKLNATQIQTDFNGFVEISWGGNGNGNSNDAAGGLLVQKNGTDISISENVQGCGRVLFEIGIARTFIINCAINDTFELNFFTPNGTNFDFGVGDIHMYVKAIRIT